MRAALIYCSSATYPTVFRKYKETTTRREETAAAKVPFPLRERLTLKHRLRFLKERRESGVSPVAINISLLRSEESFLTDHSSVSCIHPCSNAKRTMSMRLRMPSLFIPFALWTSTVLTLTSRRAAISLLLCPHAI